MSGGKKKAPASKAPTNIRVSELATVIRDEDIVLTTMDREDLFEALCELVELRVAMHGVSKLAPAPAEQAVAGSVSL